MRASRAGYVLSVVLSSGVIATVVGHSAFAVAQAMETTTPEKMAETSSETWLGLLDSGRYKECWRTAATLIQSAVTEEKFASTMKFVRDPMGGLQSRKVQSATYTTHLPGAVDGEYVVIVYQASFEHKQSAVETVTVSLAKDKAWWVSGYQIR